MIAASNDRCFGYSTKSGSTVDPSMAGFASIAMRRRRRLEQQLAVVGRAVEGRRNLEDSRCHRRLPENGAHAIG